MQSLYLSTCVLRKWLYCTCEIFRSDVCLDLVFNVEVVPESWSKSTWNVRLFEYCCMCCITIYKMSYYTYILLPLNHAVHVRETNGYTRNSIHCSIREHSSFIILVYPHFRSIIFIFYSPVLKSMLLQYWEVHTRTHGRRPLARLAMEKSTVEPSLILACNCIFCRRKTNITHYRTCKYKLTITEQ